MLRWVDDYLFITTDERKARGFLRMMKGGHPDYGCFITPEKTLTNFDHDEMLFGTTLPNQTGMCFFLSLVPFRSHTVLDVDFPWCGLRIDMETLAVSSNYLTYSEARSSSLFATPHMT